MNYYELTYLISPRLTELEAKNFSERILDLIKKEGGILGEIKNPRKRKLAYPIKKEFQAFLTSLNFYLDPGRLASVTFQLKSEGQILRSLIFTKRIPKKEEPVFQRMPKIKKEEKVVLEDIEKKLEEILGK